MPRKQAQRKDVWTKENILRYLEKHKDQNAIDGMARYGIVSKRVYGLSVTKLRELAKKVGKNHSLAQQLWKTGILDARFLAVFIDEHSKVSPTQMNRWALQFDNWAVCDGTCLHLFANTPHAWKKVVQWNNHKKEFVRRAAFTLMAILTVHDKDADDSKFENCFSLIKRASTDKRNGVKKAVNWALRQIGKRNLSLNRKAIQLAKEIHALDSSSARWIASDALRELTSRAVQTRLKKN
jgi:3-methyladenine DNA glycosylase AlkD